MPMKSSKKGSSIVRTGQPTNLPRVQARVKNSFTNPTPKTRRRPGV